MRTHTYRYSIARGNGVEARKRVDGPEDGRISRNEGSGVPVLHHKQQWRTRYALEPAADVFLTDDQAAGLNASMRCAQPCLPPPPACSLT